MTDDTYRRLYLKLFIGFLFLLVILSTFYSYKLLNTKNLGDATVLEIREGSSLSGVVNQLFKKNIIEEPLAARIILQTLGFQKKLKAGVYDILPQETLFELITKIATGDEKLYSFTIVEGRNFVEILNDLKSTKSIDSKDISNLSNEDFCELLSIEFFSPEGLFFPDTYHYPFGTNALVLLKISKTKMDQILEEEWSNRNQNLTLTSKYESLVLASIIEKETANPSERTMISGVFSNRLSKGMRLQSDPTVIYGLGSSYKGNLKKIHLKQKTSYNTYTIRGLPPTPIAMPGKDSIRAALHPETTDALYFVSMGNGSHVFSSSLKEHNRAVNRYQRKR